MLWSYEKCKECTRHREIYIDGVSQQRDVIICIKDLDNINECYVGDYQYMDEVDCPFFKEGTKTSEKEYRSLEEILEDLKHVVIDGGAFHFHLIHALIEVIRNLLGD